MALLPPSSAIAVAGEEAMFGCAAAAVGVMLLLSGVDGFRASMGPPLRRTAALFMGDESTFR